MSDSARSCVLTAMLVIGLATEGVAQTSSAKGLWCGEPHRTARPPDKSVWTVSGRGWATSCNGDADCKRVMREHICAEHPRECAGTGPDLATIVGKATGDALAALPGDQQIVALGGLVLLNELFKSSANSAANAAAAARAAEAARAAAEEAARVRAEEEARKARETQKYLEDNLKGMIGPVGLQAKLTTSRVPLQPKLTGAFGTNVAPRGAVSDAKRPQSARDVSTAWKQLVCATEIARKAAGASSLEDIVYLTKETTAAINGVSFGEPCQSAGQRPTISAQAMSVRKEALKSAVSQLAAAAEKAAAPSPAPAPVATPAPLPPAAATRVQTDDEKRIAEVFRQQKENERKLDEKIAPVREAQKAINALGGLPEFPPEQDHP